MNNNRNNNRRRGRGTNNGSNRTGGGQQLNRIDSRARGNAPQLLEKYRKLAHDAHLNGDRVQEEYYLQFADHYFRVLADSRVRPEDQRPPRQDRWQEGGSEGWREEGEEGGENAGEGEYGSYDQQPAPQQAQQQPQQQQPRRERDDRPRAPRPTREDRERSRDEEPAEAPRAAQQDEAPAQEVNLFEPPENPFLRESRPSRGLKPRREDRRPRSARDDADGDGAEDHLPLDPASLPPAISAVRVDVDGDAEVPAKRPRGRPRKKPAGDDGGETLESVG